MLNSNLSAIFYLISSVFFILALKGLSSPESSRRGNIFGMIGNGYCSHYIDFATK